MDQTNLTTLPQLDATIGNLADVVVSLREVLKSLETEKYEELRRQAKKETEGPFLLEFKKTVHAAALSESCGWERNAARQLSFVDSFEELIETLTDGDVNLRILTANIIGQNTAWLSNAGRERIILRLVRLLRDPTANEYPYDGPQCDADSVSYVSSTAATALAQLGYAGNSEEVFEKARQNGFPVEERRNVS